MSALVDTHCHLDAPEFARDATDVRQRARRAGVVHCLIPAVHTAAFDAVRTLAHQGGDSYALGIHPLFTPQASQEDLETLDGALTEHANDPRLVAVGEIGLDYFVPGLDADKQEFFYRQQLRIARRHGLPVVLHVRRSADRLLRHLREVSVQGIAHAFNGSEQQAHEFIALGFKLGFGGAVTYDRALQLRRLAAGLPLSALVLETDAPDIPPHWLYRTAQERAQGLPQGRNEPGELARIAEVVAGLRGIAVEELAEATTQNAQDVVPRLAALLADGPVRCAADNPPP
ncbi:TatD family deoxyribonuclease [Ramlibacter henchirensis]|uniref:TatD family deoxyribonuclease n=1 Tax=Ramlibacter henchirensis TaxID=204072 RepID=A0A4Z0C9E5_9BURK|nr:TatD family hydrolase [Ramlibacter henchirensis]TFZ07584.1 TatD family deoxyribonuclease [Ramlibacter henchirensis]